MITVKPCSVRLHHPVNTLLKIFLCYFLTFLSFQLFGQPIPGLPFITNYFPSDYRQGAQNFTVIQNKQGLLVFGNENGVLYFDGVRWSLTPVANKTEVHSLAEDSAGLLYVGAQGDFGFIQEEGGTRQFVSMLSMVDSAYHDFNDVWSIHLIEEAVVFRSTRYIFIYSTITASFKVIALEATSHRSFMVNGEIWVAQAGKALKKLQNAQLVSVVRGEQFENEIINAGFPYPGDRILLVSEKRGLLIYQNGEVTPLASMANEIIVGQNIYGNQLPDYSYALGTRKDGLLIVRPDGSIRAMFGKGEGIADPSVWAMISDRYSGNLWLATNNGVCVIELESPFTTLQSQVGLQGQFHAFADFDGSYYAAGALGVYRHSTRSSQWTTKGYRNFELISSLEDPAWFLYSDSTSLIATTNHGIFQITNNQAYNIGFADRAWYVQSLKKFPGYLLANTVDGIKVIVQKGNRYAVQRTLQQKFESLYYFAEDEFGSVWVNSPTRGLYRFRFLNGIEQEPEIIIFDKRHGLPDNYKIRPFTINGSLAFGTAKGLYRFNDDTQKFEPWYELNRQFWGDATVMVELMAEDRNGNIYGVYRSSETASAIGFKAIRQTNGKYRYTDNIFCKIRSHDINGISFTQHGNLMLTTSDGLIHMNVSEYEIPSYPTRISRVEALQSDSLITIRPAAEVPFEFNNIRFQFAAMGFDGQQETQYAYWLEGFEDTWSPITTIAQKEYTNLPAGQYTFRVKSTNSYNRVSDEASYQFTIVKPWYQTGWAYGGYALLMVVGLVLGSQWRSRNLLSANARLEEKIRERTEEIQQQHNEILEKNQQLESQNAEIEAQKENLEAAHQRMEYINQNLEQMVEVRTQELKTAYTNLLELKGELDTFIYRSSHDIKGPLLRLLGLTYVAKADVPDAKAQHYFSLLEEEIAITNRMLQKLITYQHLKNTVPVTETVDLAKLFVRQLELLKSYPRFSEFTIKIPQHSISISTNEELISIALHSILENSITYYGIQSPAINIQAETSEDFLRIRISDNGRGIEESTRPKIFEMFFRGSEMSRGAGLGLAIAREAIHQLRGSLRLIDFAGWQTTFEISLPLNPTRPEVDA